MARIRKKHSPAYMAQVALEAAKQTRTIAELARQFQVHMSCQRFQSVVDSLGLAVVRTMVRTTGPTWISRKILA